MRLQPSRTGLSFSLSTKLALGFLLAIALPAVIVSVIFLTARQDIDRRNIESYTRQVGQQQRQSLTTLFSNAKGTLRGFAESRDTNRLLIGLLLDDVNSTPPLPISTEQEVAAVMDSQLLNPATTIFQDVLLLDQDGIVAASAGNQVLSTFDISQDASNSAAYQRITRARADDPTVNDLVVVTQRGQPVVEVVQAVRLRDTEVIVGYLVATLDIEATLIPNLRINDPNIPVYSFLLSNNGIIISPPASNTVAGQSTNTVGISRAREGETNFDIYRIEGGVGEEVGGYYTTIQGTPFIMVTQIPVAAVLRQLEDYFGAFGFIVFVALHGIILVIFVFLYNRNLTQPIASLKRAMQAVATGNFDVPVPELNRADEMGDLARTFVDMRQETQALIQELQTRIQSRARDVQATQEISRVAVTQRNLDSLMNDVVELIVERFPNIYHAQIFLINEDQRYAILRASTGEAGRKLLERGHRLGVGSISVIGQVTAQGEIIVARDTAFSEVHKRNEFLPETRAELAVPLRIGEDIIGALDVQSREGASFNNDQIQVLQIMADQIAVAIENARLYQESVRRIRSVRDRTRDETLRAWRDYMFDNRTQRLVRRAGTPTDVDLDHLREQALATGQPVVGEVTERDTIPLAVPLWLRGEIVGVVAWELIASDYDGNTLQLAKDLVDRFAMSLDNTRLFEQSQRATERERLVNEISAKLTAETEVSEILQTAIREVGQALRAPQVSIRLNQDDQQTNS